MSLFKKKVVKKVTPELYIRRDALICYLKGLGSETISLSTVKKYFKR